MLVLQLSIGACQGITRYSTRDPRPHRLDDWRNSQIKPEDDRQYRNWFRDGRSIDAAPPQLPWVEALKHSLYLTLVREKIDGIVDKSGFNKDYREDDVDLWENIRRAPFRMNGKERGPIFGDIAILSRGKLIESKDGYMFVEDEDVRDCIECHLYSARSNELEAEKMLRKVCKGTNCENNNVRALWTVRRIRHRNYNDDEPPYRYELMFSIAAAKSDSENLNYNSPTQTFTISETDRSVTRQEPYERKKYIPLPEGTTEKSVLEDYNKKHYVVFNEDYVPVHSSPSNLYKEAESHTERTYWIHRNIDYRQMKSPNRKVHFPESVESHEDKQSVPVLNTGEIYFNEQNKGIKSQHYHFVDNDYIQSGYKPDSKIKANKKYENGDKVFTEIEYGKYENDNVNRKLPTITHLHHHYYLDDDGVPILKYNIPSTHFANHEIYLPNPSKESYLPKDLNKPIHIYSEDKTPSTKIYNPINQQQTSNTIVSNTYPSLSTMPIVIPESEWSKFNNFTNTNNFISPTITTIPQTTQQTRRVRPTKPFRPSPEEVKIKYSEMDPLYLPTTSIPISHFTESQIDTTILQQNNSESKQFTSIQPPVSTEILSTTFYPATETTLDEIKKTEFTSAHTYIENTEEEKNTEVSTEKIQMVLPEENFSTTRPITRQSSYSTTRNDRRSTKVSENKKAERPTRKSNRRVKLQKNFAELVNAQLPPPEKSSGATTPYTVATVTQPSFENIRKPTVTPIDDITPTVMIGGKSTRNRTNFVPRNPRAKYQRKTSNWSSRKIQPRAKLFYRETTTTEPTTKIQDDNDDTNATVDIRYITNTHENFSENPENETTRNFDNTTDFNEPRDDYVTRLYSTTIIDDVTDVKTETTIFDDSQTEYSKSIPDIDNSETDNIDATTTDYSNVKTTYVTSESYRNYSSVPYEDEFTPLTKKSLVTSISLKLGNKTMPFVSTQPSKNVYTENEDSENSEKITEILQEYDLKNPQSAVVSKIDKNDTDFNIYKAEEVPKNKNLQEDTKEIDIISRKIINHAKSVNLGVYNKTI